MVSVYAIGSNGSGQLGIGHKYDVSVPKPLDVSSYNLEPDIRIRSGGNHTLVQSCGRLYSTGQFSQGARGTISDSANSDVKLLHLQLPVSGDDQTLFCAASWEASFVVRRSESGRADQIWSFGSGEKGELGLGQFLFRTSKPELMKDFPPPGLEIIDLAASIGHVVAVLSNGDVYGWGNGRKGQLGSPDEIVYSPRKVQGIGFPVNKVICGREFTYAVGDHESGQHAVIGSDKWGVKSSALSHIRGWKEIGASWGTIFVLINDGTLLSWGRDDHGQLGPPNLPPLSQIAIGSEHALGLTEGGEVMAWGWGEHGNCGPSTVDGDVKGRWNVIASEKHLPEGSKILSISAGCATSFVCVAGPSPR